jgi:hypothetical protein
MTAISKSWVTIADSAVDPDSPVDTTLMTGLRDDLVHVREWLGASYYAGAVQDHNHDGVNSAMMPIGPNLLRNGSFDGGSGLDGWTQTPYTDGSISVNTSNESDGVNCVAITSTVLANGGGYITSDEYVPAVYGRAYTLGGLVHASVANVSSKVEIKWYDQAKALVSSSTLQSSSATPTSATEWIATAVAPSTAKYMRVVVTGGVPATGSATGTVYFDALYLSATITRAYLDGSSTLANGVTAVTQSVGNNSTLVATTAFCENGFVNNDIYDSGVGCITHVMKGMQAAWANNEAVSGANLTRVYQSSIAATQWTQGPACSGTWRNISGTSVPYEVTPVGYVVVAQRIS